MKVYIAGAITNNPRYKEQFETAEKRLISMNHAVINPVKNLGFEYREYIDMGLCDLMKCDAIYLLDGYEKSKGAQLELLYAQTVGMRIIEETLCASGRTVKDTDKEVVRVKRLRDKEVLQ